MIQFGFNPAPKRKKQQRETTAKVRKEIDRRSRELFNTNVRCCECCGTSRDLTAAHIENRSQGGSGAVPWNIVLLCGSHGTKQCHEWTEYTADGRAWLARKGDELVNYYTDGAGSAFFPYTRS